MKNITLHYAPDNASLIIRIILEELNLPYTAVLVDRTRDEQNSQSYLALNPTGLIPTCIIDDETITETAAIAVTICERSHSSMVLSPDHPQRCQFLRWLFFMANTIHSDLRQVFYADKFIGRDVNQQTAFRQRTRVRLAENLTILEGQYKSAGTAYLFGSEPCVIDVYLALSLRWLQLYPTEERGTFTLAGYPSIRTMLSVLQLRPAVVSACAAEGITGEFFTNADSVNPEFGSAT